VEARREFCGGSSGWFASKSLCDFGDPTELETQQLINKPSSALSKSVAWAMVVGASSVVGGCGNDTPEVKPETTVPPAAATAPPPRLTAAEKAALKKKQLTEDEPSAQERRRAKLKSKTAE